MKRDLDLVRRILLALEASPHGFAPATFTVPGYDQETIGHHVWLMHQGGLLTAEEVTAQHDPSPIALPEAITWRGHEFLDTTRSDRVWRTLKAALKDKAISLPFSLIEALALKIAKQLAGLE
jgi:uncharacterized protein DUF2513